MLRLFCFPCAGASAAYYSGWMARLPSHIEVRPIQLPGRANRLREPLVRDVQEMVDLISIAIAPLLDRRFAFFGHSLGALLAFETGRRLRRAGQPTPVHLYVSGRRAPQVDVGGVPYDDLVARLAARFREVTWSESAPLDEAVLNEIMLPPLHADCCVSKSYKYVDELPLDCPMTVMIGTDDEQNCEEALDPWCTLSTGLCVVERFAGDHNYLESNVDVVLDALSAHLKTLAHPTWGRS